MDYIEILLERILCKDGRGPVEKALHDVYFYGPFSSKALARELLLPVPVLTALKKESIKLGIWEQDAGAGIRITDEGKRYFEEDYGFGGIDRVMYLRLLESEKRRELLIQELSDKNRKIFNQRPSVDVTIDQAKCTVETSFRRAMLCLCNGTLIGKKVLCLGDDDLVSISLGLLLRHIFPAGSNHKTDICVFEIDERYVEYINELAVRYSLPVRCERINLRSPLPISLLNSFDCFFTDPPYTVEGASLFLSRGISALKKERGLNIFFSFGNKPTNELFALQKCFQLHGLSIRELYQQFNEYEGASLLGNTGQMMVLETTDQTRTVVPVDKGSRRNIYTGVIKPRNSSYVCKECRHPFVMGGGQFLTIEELKANGCPFCGNKSFEQQNKKFSAASPASPKSLGRHILADFYGCRATDLDSPAFIQDCMHNAAIKANATIVQEDFHKFSPWGVSGVVVIQESHLTIHTWPEYSYAAVDLFTCGDGVDPWAAFDYLKAMLKCDNVEYSDISRGQLNDLLHFNN